VLAEFMVMWRWENILLNKFFNWSLKMPQVMCCYQTPMMLLAMGISVKNAKRHRKERSGKKHSQQFGCTWIEVNNEVQTLVVIKTTLR